MMMYSWFRRTLYCVILSVGLLKAVVECAENCAVEGLLRLEGLSSDFAGRVEICHNNVWGTICVEDVNFDDTWSEKNAQVVCRALGYSGALNSILHNTIPDANKVLDQTVPIHYSQVRCSGEQESLMDCSLSEITSECSHDQDAAIVCRQYERDGHVRLVGDIRDEVGAVELYYPGIGWTGICADPDRAQLWLQDDQAAQLVCRQLGYKEGKATVDPLDSTFIANRSITINKCDFDVHYELTQCDTSVLTSECTTNNLAWVQCSLGTHEYGDASRAGSSREGVVQLEFSGRRGHICNTGWDNVDAEVACVEFNLDNAQTNYDTNPEGNFTKYMSDLMPVWVTNVRCTTTEQSDGDGGSETVVNENDVIDCDRSVDYPVGFTDCHIHDFRDRIALVDCGTPHDPLLPLYIVVGIFSPIILISLCIGAYFLYFKCRERGRGLTGCIGCLYNALISCLMCKYFRRSRTRSRTFPRTEARTRTTTTTDIEMQSPGDIFYEPTGDEDSPPEDSIVPPSSQPGDIFYEPTGDEDSPPDTYVPPSSQPADNAELTKNAPPGYSEAVSYTTVQDGKEQLPPPPLPED